MRRPSLVLLLSTGSALRPTTRTAKNAASNAPKTALKEGHAANRLNAAALEEELKTNTPYWHDNRIHSFGNVGFGGVQPICRVDFFQRCFGRTSRVFGCDF